MNQVTNLFSIHAGVITNHNSTSAGQNSKVVWKMRGSERRLRYLHMNSFSVNNNNYVMAGQIIGIAGRTGNLSGIWPCHVHLDDGYGSHSTGILSFRNSIDEYNRKCIPNYYYPLLFPCRGGAVLNPSEDPSNCYCQQLFANNCWAILELRCPYLHRGDSRLRKIQAQLRYLGYYTGAIDGQWGGALPTNESRISNTRTAIYNFKRDNDLLIVVPDQAFNQANYNIINDDENVLNTNAPIRVS